MKVIASLIFVVQASLFAQTLSGATGVKEIGVVEAKPVEYCKTHDYLVCRLVDDAKVCSYEQLESCGEVSFDARVVLKAESVHEVASSTAYVKAETIVSAEWECACFAKALGECWYRQPDGKLVLAPTGVTLPPGTFEGAGCVPKPCVESNQLPSGNSTPEACK